LTAHRTIFARLRGALKASLARWEPDEKANVAVEFSFIAPILVFVGVATFDYGAGVYRQMQVQEAAQLGAQYAVVHGFDSSAISDTVVNSTSYSSIAATPAPTSFCGCVSSGAVVETTCGNTCADGHLAGTYVTVHSAATYSTTLPYPSIPSSFALAGQATMRLQ